MDDERLPVGGFGDLQILLIEKYKIQAKNLHVIVANNKIQIVQKQKQNYLQIKFGVSMMETVFD